MDAQIDSLEYVLSTPLANGRQTGYTCTQDLPLFHDSVAGDCSQAALKRYPISYPFDPHTRKVHSTYILKGSRARGQQSVLYIVHIDTQHGPSGRHSGFEPDLQQGKTVIMPFARFVLSQIIPVKAEQRYYKEARAAYQVLVTVNTLLFRTSRGTPRRSF